VQVDLDPEVVSACRTHLPTFGADAWTDPRFSLVHDDVRAHLERTDEPFDAIVLDVPEWLGGTELERLYEPSFYALLARRLAPGGVISGQIGPVHPTRASSFLPFARARQEAFPHTSFYVVPELGWVFGLASVDPPVEPSGSHGDALLSPVRYYSPELHARLSFLPPYLRAGLARG
jgi:spermidine synthase